MDLDYTPEQLAFRDEVRALDRRGDAGRDEAQGRCRRLASRTPRAWSGTASSTRRAGSRRTGRSSTAAPAGTSASARLFQDELCAPSTPELSPFGLSMVGPLLIQFGSEEQKQRFLPKILSGDEVWCQGYSEPNAGSDLASLQLRAEKDGDDYVLNGQKTWTTYAQYADWIFVLCRTDAGGKKQEGISFLLADVRNTPGITVKPFLTTGGTDAFCETWFANARVPQANRVGPENGGWAMAKALLGHERTPIGGVAESGRWLRRVKQRRAQHAASATARCSTIRRSGAASRGSRCATAPRELANQRTLAAAQLGRAPGAESSILKIVGTELQQELTELAMDAMGHDGAGLVRLAGGSAAGERALGGVAVQLPARRDDLRRVQRDPEEHHREADPRPALGLSGRTRSASFMNFDLSDEQQMLVDTVAKFVEERLEPRALPQAARQRARLGDRDVGAHGRDGLARRCRSPRSTAASAAASSTWRCCSSSSAAASCPSRCMASVVLAGGLLSRLGSRAQRERFLAPMIAGPREPRVRVRRAPEPLRPGRLRDARRDARLGLAPAAGRKVWVLNGHAADQLVVLARTSGAPRRPRGALALRRRSSAHVVFRVPRSTGWTASAPGCVDARRRRGRRRPPARRRGRGARSRRVGDRPRRRRGLRRGPGPGAGALRAHRRVPEAAQAVRRADRQLPGAPAPRGRHVRRDGAVPRRDARWRRSRPTATTPSCAPRRSRPRSCSSRAAAGSCRRTRSSCTAASASPTSRTKASSSSACACCRACSATPTGTSTASSVSSASAGSD